MKTSLWKLATIFLAVLCLTFFGAAVSSAKGPGSGGGGGGGGGAPDLGDLIVLHRDAWGIPILTDDLCQQPLAAPGVPLPADDPYYSGCTPSTSDESCIIPVDPETCAVLVGYETFTQEVDFGRTSVIRSPLSVIEQSLGEVVTKLATAQCTTLDPAGRLVNTSLIDGIVFSATIDSPLENLAIYRQLMLKGYLGADANPIVLPYEVLNMAARGLGAAADKTGKVTVDQVVYSNEIMGLTDESTYLPKICLNVREEVQGTVQLVRKCFLNYGGKHDLYENIGGTFSEYEYNRADNFLALPDPPYIPAAVDEVQKVFNNADGGTFTLSFYGEKTEPIAFNAAAEKVEEVLEVLEAITDVVVTGAGKEADPWVIVFVDPGAQDVPPLEAIDDFPEGGTTIKTTTEGIQPNEGWFEYLSVSGTGDISIEEDDIMSTVFGEDSGFLYGNIGGFTQAADDTREVINFMHDHPLPVGSETPVPPCDDPANTDDVYDLSISEESGLQVPKRMVADAEEPREIIVTVANAGPDTATGWVELIGIDASGNNVFKETENFEITGGGTDVSEWLFSLGYATTVSWTATATPDCVLCDLNTSNNTVNATTKVMTTGGGGGGKR